jgi:hypothetical protein
LLDWCPVSTRDFALESPSNDDRQPLRQHLRDRSSTLNRACQAWWRLRGQRRYGKARSSTAYKLKRVSLQMLAIWDSRVEVEACPPRSDLPWLKPTHATDVLKKTPEKSKILQVRLETWALELPREEQRRRRRRRLVKTLRQNRKSHSPHCKNPGE